ncbi:hypothetical protein [Ideonella sp. BN130291]|uniref:hypothetical protein n=1 Tax=Ideonella sp. BN130291 TaxID=3112940 RepID=UPI002E260C39|nr:hypothetical protein [Ideonella sp. BN130291]
MKEYKLSAWPDLPAPFHRTSYRRMLSDMSHRFVSTQQLMATSGATRMEVRSFLQMLADRGLLCEREAPRTPLSGFSGWLRRTFQNEPEDAHTR